jgi:hypothetical protein
MAATDRFEAGGAVIFRRNGNGGQCWFEGKVLRSDRGSCRCRVQEERADAVIPGETERLCEPGDTFTVQDSDIRVFPEGRPMTDLISEAKLAFPASVDPNAHLYADLEHVHPLDPHTFDSDSGVAASESHTDGSQIIHMHDGRRVGTAVLMIPEGPVYGIDPQDMMMMSSFVISRRKVNSEPVVEQTNFKRIVPSVLPSERNMIDLKDAAQRNPAKMLQLGDAMRYGIFGWPKDSAQSTKCYICAAWGCSEQEASPQASHFAYPPGPPEALCAAASALWELVAAEFSNHNHLSVVEESLRRNDPGLMALLHTIVFFLCHAIRRDWLCSLALAIGQALRDTGCVDTFLPHSIHMLNALECRNMQLEKPPGIGDKPSPETLERFTPKATEIFLGMPAQEMPPSGQVRSDVHIEYREMPFPPYPLLVLGLNPPSRYLYGPCTMPELYEYCPYSRGAFENLWAQIVFSFHTGYCNGIRRQRPAVLTFLDRPGDKSFAAFVQEQIGTTSGTEIRLVSHDYQITEMNGRSKRLGDILEESVSSLVSTMRGMRNYDEIDIRTPAEQMSTAFHNRLDTPVEELRSRVEELKEQGNDFFTRGRTQPAKSCYSEAIDMIRLSSNQNNDIYRLLGTLLSNRAACFLKMAEGMNPESAKQVLKSAETDCHIALESSWTRSIPPQVRAKLERRKSDAVQKKARLVSRFMTPEMQRYLSEREQQQASQPESLASTAGRERGGRRRRNETQRQRQRRRRRQQNSNQGAENSDVHADNSGEAPAAEAQGETQGENKTPDMDVLLGGDLLVSQLATNVSEREDPCPCCLGRFRVELENTYTAVLSCNHACCLPCLARLKKASGREEAVVSFTCPLCRVSVPDEFLEPIAAFIITQTMPLQERLVEMHLSEQVRTDVARQLLDRHDFVVADVLGALDSMLVDNLQSALDRVEDLSPEEKSQIYTEARRPVDALLQQLRNEQAHIEQLRDQESDEYKDLARRVDELQRYQIPAAHKNARDEIFNSINSAGGMGRESESGVLHIDFHALHVDEAKTKFDEDVMPVLPVVKTVLLIVGRGRNSDGGVAKLKPSIQSHIEQHPQHRKMRWAAVKGNAGALHVIWKKN